MNDNAYIENQESESNKTTSKGAAKRSNLLVSLINGDFLSKEFVVNNLNFIFYFIFMLLLLVAKGYYGKQLTKEVDVQQRELNEILSDYVTKKAKLEEDTRRINLSNELAPLGLKETVNPTKVIRLEKSEQ